MKATRFVTTMRKAAAVAETVSGADHSWRGFQAGGNAPNYDEESHDSYYSEDHLPRAEDHDKLANEGATVGTARKSMRISDITSAMVRPA